MLHKDSATVFQQFRNKYEFITVVYLKDGCNPCYPKFVEWHQKMEELDNTPGHTILFVIQTHEYSSFISKVRRLGEDVNEKYYVVIDPDYQFITHNNRLPKWIMNSSMLIDRDNKIKMVGAPWINDDTISLFSSILNVC